MTPQRSIRGFGATSPSRTPRGHGTQCDVIEQFFIKDIRGTSSICSSLNGSPRKGSKKRVNNRSKNVSPRHKMHQWSMSTNMSCEDEHSLKEFIVYERAGGPCVTKRIYGIRTHEPNSNDDNCDYDDNENDNDKETPLDSRRNSLSSFDSNETFVMDGVLGKKEYRAYKACKEEAIATPTDDVDNVENVKKDIKDNKNLLQP